MQVPSVAECILRQYCMIRFNGELCGIDSMVLRFLCIVTGMNKLLILTSYFV